ncbi:MAG: aldolase/citrate lyase family protein [Tistlia sp.]|uniref:HpcH/HpaI aldolase/citrate lyase family protein n=1 Tax=Tistlia sp. TaxID=3057121 RepID=UPI0034A0FCBD
MDKTLKQRLQADEPLVGCFVMLPSPGVVEMCGYAGFDFVILDQEHGAAGTESLENQIRAAEASGVSALVRIPEASPSMAQHALDAGAEGLLVPHITSAEVARQIVAAAHYPPQGARGMATTSRAGRHGTVTVDDHLKRSLERTLVMLQIEDRAVLPDVEEIAGMDGVDALFIGPADLSVSLGHPGNPGHPEVAAEIDRIVATAKRVGRAKVATFARNEANAESWRKDRGVEVLCLSTTAIFVDALKALSGALVRR